MSLPFKITEEEKQKVLETYIRDGKLDTFPRKEKRKYIILLAIIHHFEAGRIYSEREVNEKLKTIYDDFATIRRYLIDYRLMERNKDGTEYWVSDLEE